MHRVCRPCQPNKARRPALAAGFSIAVILTAVALMAALSVAVLLGSRRGSGGITDGMEHSRMLGAVVIDQARNLKEGIAKMTANGVPINSITFDTASGTGLFDPLAGGAEVQTPSPDTLWASDAAWVWKVDGSGNPVVKLYSIGIDANPDYVIALPGLSAWACWGANAVLNSWVNNWGNTPTLAAGALADWQTPATPIDLSSSSAGTQGWREGCYTTTDDNYVYVATVRAQ